ncbi:MAG TPA: Gfo/Idh/MocA family oxidoreductase [Cyclobacteriaceae bacterium]
MNKLKIGIVGLGRLGFTHAVNISGRIKGAELVAACSLKQDELSKASAELGIPVGSCYQKFEDMLAKEKLDAVAIVSSSDQHCKQVLAALQWGLHVFCEKPLGVTIDECKEVEQAVAKFNKQVFMLGFMRRYDASYQYAKQKMDEGYIGRPILFRSYSVDPDHSIKGTLAYLPDSAGQFLDMAVHDIDLARWMLNSEPKTIYAAGGSYAYPEFEKYNDGDNAAAFMQFENQSMAFLLAGRTAPHGYNIETEIIGTKATLRIGSVPQKNLVELLDHSGIRKECSQSFPERFSQAFESEMQEFVDCILENRKPGITAHDGTRATEIAIASTQSFRNKELVKL